MNIMVLVLIISRCMIVSSESRVDYKLGWNVFISGYLGGDRKNFNSLEEAKNSCSHARGCGGITREPVSLCRHYLHFPSTRQRFIMALICWSSLFNITRYTYCMYVPFKKIWRGRFEEWRFYSARSEGVFSLFYRGSIVAQVGARSCR